MDAPVATERFYLARMGPFSLRQILFAVDCGVVGEGECLDTLAGTDIDIYGQAHSSERMEAHTGKCYEETKHPAGVWLKAKLLENRDACARPHSGSRRADF